MSESDPGFGVVAIAIAFGLWFSIPGVELSPMLWVSGLPIYVWTKHARRFTGALAVALYLASLSLSIDRDATLGQFTVPKLAFDAAMCALIVAVPWGVGTLVHTVTRQVADARNERDNALMDLRRELAAELHDTVAQSQALVVIQAEDSLALPDVPLAVQAELYDIIATTRQSARDLRSMLTVLAKSNATTMPLEVSAPLSLTDIITRHVTNLNAAGFTAVASTPDDLDMVPTSIRQTAAHIVRELASNVRWYGKPGPCTITVAHTQDVLTIDITNQVSAHPRKQPGGFGLANARERANVHHEHVDVDTTVPGQWIVHVSLPIHSR